LAAIGALLPAEATRPGSDGSGAGCGSGHGCGGGCGGH
jgi:hypothetical protein